jgi:hypothetical protein
VSLKNFVRSLIQFKSWHFTIEKTTFKANNFFCRMPLTTCTQTIVPPQRSF